MSTSLFPEQTQQLTQSYVKSLTANELQELFIKLSNQFSSRLNSSKGIDELKELQAYLRIIAAEMSARLNVQ